MGKHNHFSDQTQSDRFRNTRVARKYTNGGHGVSLS